MLSRNTLVAAVPALFSLIWTCGLAAGQDIANGWPKKLVSREEGQAIVQAARLHRAQILNKPDCSHWVHDVYTEAGLDYEFAASREIFAGVAAFQRVRKPQPGDLIVWQGHVGIVIDPEDHSFFSSVNAGFSINSYVSSYWRSRGVPRFYRYQIDALQSARLLAKAKDYAAPMPITAAAPTRTVAETTASTRVPVPSRPTASTRATAATRTTASRAMPSTRTMDTTRVLDSTRVADPTRIAESNRAAKPSPVAESTQVAGYNETSTSGNGPKAFEDELAADSGAPKNFVWRTEREAAVSNGFATHEESDPDLVVVSTAPKPTKEEVRLRMNGFAESASEKLLQADSSEHPIVIMDRFDVDRIETHGKFGWAELTIKEIGSFVDGRIRLGARVEKVRLALEQQPEGWILLAHSGRIYLPREAAAKVIAARIAVLARSSAGSQQVKSLSRALAMLQPTVKASHKSMIAQEP